MTETKQAGAIHQVALADYTPVSPVEKEDRGGWVRYGEDNLFPKYLIELYETTPVHGPLCTSIAKMIAGDGLEGDASAVGLLSDKKIDKTAFDLKIGGSFFWEVIWSKDGQSVAQINHLPFENCRLSKADDTDEITGIWYSKDWGATRKKGCEPVFIPRFNKAASTSEPRQVYYHSTNIAGSQYYGKPDYFSAVNYIELARQIGIYHVNNIMNGFFPSFIISQFNGIPDPETKRQIINEWNRHASGARNAGKAFFTFHEAGTTPPSITTFPLSDADKQYQYLEESQMRNIMMGHRVTSPLLFGIRDSSGLGSNADELRQALAIFNAYVIKPAQQDIVEAIEIITGAKVTVKPYVPFEVEQSAQTAEGKPAEDVASQALNGAQITSLIEIVIQVAAGAIPKDSGRAIIQSAFPTLTPDQINEIFNSIVPGSLQPEEIVQRAVMRVLEKKKPEFTAADESAWLTHLADRGEVIDAEEWELVREDEAGDHAFEADLNEKYNELARVDFSLSSYANGEDKSEHGDRGLYKLRYAYSQNLTADSREFCREMVGLSKAGRVFRYEDIKSMEAAGVNGQFSPQGSSTYDIFTWKGGVYCHHFWKRQIYLRKRDSKGNILPNKGLENDKRVGNVPFLPRKGAEGVAPIDTPSRGSLKNT